MVTGGSGFIGYHLCRRLRGEGNEVHATSREPRRAAQDGPHWWKADTADLDTVRRLLHSIRPDIIYHLAGSVGASPRADLVLPTYHSLLTSTVNILVGALETGCRRLILSGSFTEPQPDLQRPTPASPYAAAKWAASGYGRMFHSLFEAPVVILQPFMVYGPAQAPTKLVPSVIRSLLHGRAPEISSGRRRADWIYIDDVIDGFVAAAVKPGIEGTTIDLGSGSLVSIRGIVERLVAIVGTGTAPTFGALPDRPGENEMTANTTVAAELLDWKATTALDQGLQQTVAWHRANPERT
jgi:nucleoside-diphosphate-sugar epimerase